MLIFLFSYVFFLNRYINFLAEMVESDKNPISEAQIQAQKEEKKIIVHSPRGKPSRIRSSRKTCNYFRGMHAPAFIIALVVVVHVVIDVYEVGV